VATRVLGWPAFKPETGNPYNGLLYRALERHGARVEEFSPLRLLRGRYDVWHIHWPERIAHRSAALARLTLFGTLVVWARLRGTRIVWTVHNLEGHGHRHPELERRFMSWFARRLDAVLCASEAGVVAAVERFPTLRSKPAAIVPLGHYAGHYPNEISRADARVLLGLVESDRVVTFVGRINPYKNVCRLVDEFRWLDEPDARLVVAGRPDSSTLLRAIAKGAAGDERILLRLDDVADDELQVVLNAADLVVLPYERILNSGAALLALSFGRPVLVPDTGSMADLQAELGADAVRLYHGGLRTEHLRKALAAPTPDPAGVIARLREAHDWDAIADRTLSLYAEAAR